MRIGSKVTPVTPAGLWLADRPVDGKYHQKRKKVCVFTDVGKIIDRSECVIDYDDWNRRDGFPEDIGKVRYVNYLIQCNAGTGWGGEGAVIASNKRVQPTASTAKSESKSKRGRRRQLLATNAP